MVHVHEAPDDDIASLHASSNASEIHHHPSLHAFDTSLPKDNEPSAQYIKKHATNGQSSTPIKEAQQDSEALMKDIIVKQSIVSIDDGSSQVNEVVDDSPSEPQGECSLVVKEHTSRNQGDVIMVDWFGRPITKKDKLGGPRPSFFILGVIVCGYFTFGGLFFNLVLYLRRVWDQGSATAANTSTNLVGTVYCTCIVGAFLGDTYIGRMSTVAIFLTIYTLGCALSALGVTLKEIKGATSQTFLMLALYVTSMGCGSYQPVIVSLGGDQFDIATQKARFFSWVFVASNLGVMLALTILTYLENMGRWALGYWISTTSLGLSILLYFIGVPYMQQMKLGGNPLLSMLQVFVSAICNFQTKVDLSTCLPEKNKEEIGELKISYGHSLRWLDKAAIIKEKNLNANGVANPWRLCTMTQVEEVKQVIRVIPFIIVGIAYNVANAQLVSLFVVQGDTMENLLWGFRIPPGSMRLFTNLVGIIFPPIYEFVLVPKIRLITHHEKGFTTLQRMGWGLVFGAKAMVVAALIEKNRLHSSFKLSILWLIPQFTIMGISNSLFIVSQIDFFYSEIPQRMQSLGSSLFLLCMGLGNYGSSLLVTIVNHLSSLHNATWIPPQIDEGHLDSFFWLLVGILLLTLLAFLLSCSSYRYFNKKLMPS